jgi:hypothetical protein
VKNEQNNYLSKKEYLLSVFIFQIKKEFLFKFYLYHDFFVLIDCLIILEDANDENSNI